MPSLLYFSTVEEQKRVRDAKKAQTIINSLVDVPWFACGRIQPVMSAESSQVGQCQPSQSGDAILFDAILALLFNC
jgi:hypothetical protein